LKVFINWSSAVVTRIYQLVASFLFEKGLFCIIKLHTTVIIFFTIAGLESSWQFRLFGKGFFDFEANREYEL